jgi:hypothetical protein
MKVIITAVTMIAAIILIQDLPGPFQAYHLPWIKAGSALVTAVYEGRPMGKVTRHWVETIMYIQTKKRAGPQTAKTTRPPVFWLARKDQSST